jgi:hypothetical protein
MERLSMVNQINTILSLVEQGLEISFFVGCRCIEICQYLHSPAGKTIVLQNCYCLEQYKLSSQARKGIY